ncbi:Bro-N domain-containing protein [Alistipes finegoldii]|jgi:prophage antirepressor-like protein|uniref:BRO-N domain-containing protein n=1 Tax=Alistipes finegoldii TaxID=214856 RepID=UPI003A85F6A0
MKELSIFQHPDFGTVRNVVIKGEPWFVAKDVCDILELTNSRKATAGLDDEEKGVTISDTPGGQQSLTIVNESGLYSLILQSRKPQAKAFKKWVTSEVLPSIRKYGYYISPTAPISRKERNAIERSYLKALNKYITEEDIYKVSKKVRCSDSHVRSVLNGFQRDNDVMRVLQARALANKNQWEDAYSPAKMDEVLSQLL